MKRPVSVSFLENPPIVQELSHTVATPAKVDFLGDDPESDQAAERGDAANDEHERFCKTTMLRRREGYGSSGDKAPHDPRETEKHYEL